MASASTTVAAALSSFRSLSLRPRSREFMFPKPATLRPLRPLRSLRRLALLLPKRDDYDFLDEEEVKEFLEKEYPFDPPTPPPDYVEPTPFYKLPPETEEEVTAAYVKRYGLPGSGPLTGKGRRGPTKGFRVQRRERVRDGMEVRVVEVKRVNRVTKGGRRVNFRVLVVVGDKKGKVGVGVSKAQTVSSAVEKSAADARRHLIVVPINKYSTIPHRADGKFGAAQVMLRPACPGFGISAGGAVRAVLEVAGIANAVGKQIRSRNALNNARATIVALQKIHSYEEISEYRGIPIEELWK